MKKKRIYVCCGTGIATSTVISKKVRAVLDEKRIPYEISHCTVQEVASKVSTSKPDIIVSSTTVTGDVGDVPVVIGRSFLTGLKKQETIDEILAILQD
ncbi:PTS sugar transporter subunit IIB [Listeria monocytogenes]|uniref:PTS sugar transporter subunit IIB n=1 Tax=Listeria monocytogenes TaxID=1639 RepID=UPI0024BED4C7|nr:PTS sugar transporter subunit IIB [Listeria monocytogenes]MDJ1566518.1 PTS sugar transporter subunit IIB [Listeria monocytogenes]MDJ1572418.1 PTS sugar transporter subunit IIB [Listeria monocytogenes]